MTDIIDIEKIRKKKIDKNTLTFDDNIILDFNVLDITISFKMIDFCLLFDPDDNFVVAFPTEEECWTVCATMVGIESEVVLKKLGWRTLVTGIAIQNY